MKISNQRLYGKKLTDWSSVYSHLIKKENDIFGPMIAFLVATGWDGRTALTRPNRLLACPIPTTYG